MRRVLVFGAGSVALLGMGFAVARYSTPRAQSSRAEDPQSTSALSDAGIPEPPQADERTKEMRRFDRYDRNSDGRIVAAEFLASRQKAFARLDLNHDGLLSFAEYAAKASDKFTKADKDKSQALDHAEFAATKPVRKARAHVKCPPAGQPAAEPATDTSEG